MDLHLRGKRVLITGASKGIGAAAAEAFAEEGTISKRDLELFRWCETAEEAWDHIAAFYKIEAPTTPEF